MYFLDMMNIDFSEKLNYIKISVMAIVFVALVCLTIIAIMKEKKSSAEASGEKSTGAMLKVMIILDCIFFVVAALIF